MKPFGRTYVVEVKRSRRLAKPVPNSIWHGVDLKAVAREVEEQTREKHEQLGPAVCGVELTEAGAAMSPSTYNAILDREIVSDSTASTTSIELPGNETKAKASRGEALAKSVRRRKARSESSAIELEKEDLADKATLAALDEENKRLRALWAVRLRRENHELREMLSRFLN